MTKELAEELRQKKICRFCLALPDANLTLTEIYGTKALKPTAVPLPLQIMAATGIEVYETDGLPTTICFKCRVFTDHAYKFKKMAKKADEALKQFPTTGVWPEKLRLPFEQIVVGKHIQKKAAVEPKPKAVTPKADKSPPITKPKPVVSKETSSPPAKRRKLPFKAPPTEPAPQTPDANFENSEIEILELPVIEQSEIAQLVPVQQELPKTEAAAPTATLLNKTPPKILNKCHGTKVKSEEIEIIQVLEIPSASSSDPPALVLDPDVYSCSLCERTFPLRQLLDIHLQNHQRERKFGCQWCDKQCFTKYDLAKHTMTHTGTKPFTCTICQKSFSRTTLLKRHQKIHADAPKFLCTGPGCEQYFLSEEDLNKHMTAMHLKERHYACKLCSKSFTFKQGLDRHLVNHEVVQPFKCEYCDAGFPSAGKLASHVAAHAGNGRRYPCKFCNKSYQLSHHLTRHLRSHSGHLPMADRKLDKKPVDPPRPDEPYRCNYFECNKSFSTKDSLIYHSAVHATQSLICPLCHEQFADIEATTAHIELHSSNQQFGCDDCDLIYVTETKLRQHRVKCHDTTTSDCVRYTVKVETNGEAEQTDEIQQAINKLSKCVTVVKKLPKVEGEANH